MTKVILRAKGEPDVEAQDFEIANAQEFATRWDLPCNGAQLARICKKYKCGYKQAVEHLLNLSGAQAPSTPPPTINLADTENDERETERGHFDEPDQSGGIKIDGSG